MIHTLRHQALDLRFDRGGGIPDGTESDGPCNQAGTTQTEQIANDQYAVGECIGVAVTVDIEEGLDVGEVAAEVRGGDSRRARQRTSTEGNRRSAVKTKGISGGTRTAVQRSIRIRWRRNCADALVADLYGLRPDI